MIVSKPPNYNVSNWQNCPKVNAPEVMSPKTRVLSPDLLPRVVGCNRACRWSELGDRMGQLAIATYQSILPNLEGYLCQNWSSFYSSFHLRQNWCVTRLTQLWEQICGLGSIPDSKIFVEWLINSSSPGGFFFPSGTPLCLFHQKTNTSFGYLYLVWGDGLKRHQTNGNYYRMCSHDVPAAMLEE